MNASTTKAPRVDIELRLCGFSGSQYFEFQAMNSFGQEFVMDELGLRGCGEARMKLCCNSVDEARAILRRMYADGLAVKTVNLDSITLRYSHEYP